jgi:hypothetical protein
METSKKYKLNPDKYKQYPHLAELKKECERVAVGSMKYWKLRCNYLEKAIDETCLSFERGNCREFYKILLERTR